MNPRLIGLNKPFGVVCQFSPHRDHPTLADCIRVPHVYAAGRLDTPMCMQPADSTLTAKACCS